HEQFRGRLDDVQDPELRDAMELSLERHFRQSMINVKKAEASREVKESEAAVEASLVADLQGIRDGSTTSTQVIEKMDNLVDSLPFVFGEDADQKKREFGKQAVEEQFHSLLEASPQMAVEYANGDEADEFLTKRQQDDLISTANSQVRSAISGLEKQAASIFMTDDPDRVERLQGLRVQMQRYQGFDRYDSGDTFIETRISRAQAEDRQATDHVELLFNVLSGTSSEPLPQDQVTLNKGFEQIKANGDSVDGYISRLVEAGSDLPDNWTKKDLKRHTEPATLNFTAFTDGGATRYITDEQERQARIQTLESPGAAALVTSADQNLAGEGDKEGAPMRARITLEEEFNRRTVAPKLSSLVGAIIPSARRRLRLGPAEMSALQSEYRYQFVRQRQFLGTDDPDVLTDAAIDAAMSTMLETHTPLTVPRPGTDRTYMIPSTALQFKNDKPVGGYRKEILREAGRLMRDAGAESGLLASKPIIDNVNEQSFFAITSPGGVKGFVQWDAAAGVATSVTSADKELYGLLVARLNNARSDQSPTPELNHPAGIDLPEPMQDQVVDMARAKFMEQNGGRIPETDADRQAVAIIAAGIAERHQQ
ncbi:MAG: hypothetical protein ACYSUI_25965, partial [Planctomycetota bacterium]